QRRLLAGLVAARGAVVTTDRLVDLLWGDRLPADHAAALQTHVFRVRRTLPDGAIETIGAGYRLLARPREVDAERFCVLVAEAVPVTAEDTGRGLALLDEALSLWRGEPYDELADTDAGRIEAARLREVEVIAREARLSILVATASGGDRLDVLAEIVAF